MSSPAPVLYVVATPIGNLEDITLRAIRVLSEADVVACEDTRKTRIVLSLRTGEQESCGAEGPSLLLHCSTPPLLRERHGISPTRLVSFHKFNEAKRTAELIQRLREGASVALVCNAGTPGISDPGARLVQAAVENGIRVEAVPGPSAVTAALSVSCLPHEEFVFCGFVPPRSTTRRKKFFTVKNEPRTLVFFETANRLCDSLADMLEVLGDRRIEIARELTKVHEEVIRTSLSSAASDLRDKTIKGEIVLIVEGAKEPLSVPASDLNEEVRSAMKQLGISRSEAAKLIASARGIRKQDVYRALARRDKPEP